MVPLPSYATSQAGGFAGAAKPLKALAETSDIRAKSPTMVPNNRSIKLICVTTCKLQHAYVIKLSDAYASTDASNSFE